MATTYSNPRMEAVIADWPLGRDRRGPASFRVETHPKRGERVIRTTTGKPVALTYATKSRIVDGDDGRTYVISLTLYGAISVMKGDMKLQHEVMHPNDPRYPAIRALFEEPQP